MKKTILFFIAFTSCLHSINAQWSGDPNVADTKVCTANTAQSTSYIIPDGSGGAIVFWQDQRNGSANDIYYNKLNSVGNVVWSPASVGLPLTNGGDNFIDQVISDGSGGAFISWEINDGISVQHINSAGAKTWTAGGVSLSSTGYSGFICSDGSGGIIVAWSDNRDDLTDGRPVAYTQRISSAGAKLWAAGGVLIENASGFSAPIGIIADGSGGAIIALGDTRNSNYDAVADEYDNIDIYAQRVNASGNAVWAAAGVPVCTQPKNQNFNGGGQYSYIISDGAGGAVIAWEDYRNDPNNGNSAPYNEDIYCQRLNASGVAQWATDGVALCTASGEQYEISLMPDGSGGAVATWYDERNTFRVYAQKINGSGAVQWATNGIAVASESNSFTYTASPDATNSSMLVAWVANGGDIKAEKISVSNGNLNWGGVWVCGRSDYQHDPAIAHNGGSGAIISWTDNRNSATSGDDIYANSVSAGGALPLTLISFDAQLINKNALLSWSTSSEQNTSYFDVERSMDGNVFSKIGNVDAAGNSSSTKNYSFTDHTVSDGTNFYRLKMTDADGKYIYSKTVSLNVGNAMRLQVFPNPASNVLYVKFGEENENAAVQIVDIAGRIMQEEKISLTGHSSFSIDITTLPKGIYNLIIKTNSKNEHQKFVKQ